MNLGICILDELGLLKKVLSLSSSDGDWIPLPGSSLLRFWGGRRGGKKVALGYTANENITRWKSEI